MSGFVAIVNTDGSPIDAPTLQQLLDSLKLRGPDLQNMWISNHVGFGHALFRTTDEAKYENQPASLDNRLWITGCIRIDAREDLVSKMGLQRDIHLSETPDSHLVLLAYRHWGEKCLDHLLGDFSFALWDSEKRLLFCARDRFGMRYLCYAKRGATLIVSNSIYCVRQHPSVTDELSKEAIGNFLLFGDHRWENQSHTAFADVKALPPAHYLALENDLPVTFRYWEVDSGTQVLRYKSESDYLEHFSEIFKKAISDRLRAKDIAILLSGGMDSASIAATIKEIEVEENRAFNINAVTILHDSIHESEERHYAGQVSDFLKISTLQIEGGNYPLISSSVNTACPMHEFQSGLHLYMDRCILTKSRIILDGSGGDEVLRFSSIRAAVQDLNLVKAFAKIYQLKKFYGTYPPLGTGVKSKIKKLIGRHPNSYAPLPYPNWINPEFEKEMNLKQVWSEHWSDENPSNHSLRNPALRRSVMQPDWGSDDFFVNRRSSQPERRSPFLDTRLVNFTMSLPALPWLFNKHILRKAMTGKLPAAVLSRPKTGLGFLHVSLIRQENYNDLNNWTPTSELLKYVDRSKVHALTTGPGEENISLINLRPLILNTWIKNLHNI